MTSSNKKYFTPAHTRVPNEDSFWALEQKPSVFKFWKLCWLADPYGSRWQEVTTNLSDSAFRLARKILHEAKLFIFRRVVYRVNGQDSTKWEVKNLHGARVKKFWCGENRETENTTPKSSKDVKKRIPASEKRSTSVQPPSEKDFQDLSRTPQEHLINSSEELMRCDSSTLKEKSCVDETADAPSEGTSPQITECVEEKEEPPMVDNCTSHRLVEEKQALFVSSDSENQNNGREAILNEEDDFSVSRRESKVAPDKWDEEARARRKKLRPERKNKLSAAMALGENPGVEFLKNCWEDIVLQIIVKQLVNKFPEWGFIYNEFGLINSDSRNNCS